MSDLDEVNIALRARGVMHELENLMQELEARGYSVSFAFKEGPYGGPKRPLVLNITKSVSI